MRDEIKSLAMILVLATAFTACRKSVAENAFVSPSSVPDPTPTAVSTATPASSSSLKGVDFRNFKYPSVYMDEAGLSFSEIEKKSDVDFFELKNGKLERTETQDGAALQKIEFGDVTNDGEKEAIIEISPETGGNCSCNMIYIYGAVNQKPRLLWAFGSLDRAEGGLKKVYAENGSLLVELFGDSKFENGKWRFSIPEGKFSGLCCPTVFTRTRFKWNGEKFVVQGTPEMFDFDWKNQQKERKKKDYRF